MYSVVDQSWTAQAACAGQDPDDLFVRGAAQRQAREICFTCPVRLECLIDALDNRIQFGVWGGLTERERSEEHTSELQSRGHLVCRLLLEKKNTVHYTRIKSIAL